MNAMNFPLLGQYKKSYEDQLKKYQTIEKEHGKIVINRQQLETQLTENNLVKTEMDLLEPGTNIFKLVGPTLIKQDLDESKNTVNKRIEYITDEIKRCEKSLHDATYRLAASREAADIAMKSYQILLSKGNMEA